MTRLIGRVTARGIPRLFARNERVVCVFDSPEFGKLVMMPVSATIVGSIATVWHCVVNPRHSVERTGSLEPGVCSCRQRGWFLCDRGWKVGDPNVLGWNKGTGGRPDERHRNPVLRRLMRHRLTPL